MRANIPVNELTQPPGGSSVAHKAAAIALAAVSVVAALVVFILLARDAGVLWMCIQGRYTAGPDCGFGGTLQFAIPMLILFGGFTGAAKVWRG